jgi:hypothetical protein
MLPLFLLLAVLTAPGVTLWLSALNALTSFLSWCSSGCNRIQSVVSDDDDFVIVVKGYLLDAFNATIRLTKIRNWNLRNIHSMRPLC